MIDKHPQNRHVDSIHGVDENRIRIIAQWIKNHPRLPAYIDNPDFRATTRRPDQFTPSAVLIPVIKRSELSLLFTHRADHLPNHAGEISFPGGKLDADDASLIATALRETEEELGIKSEHIETLATLPTVKVLSGFEITPVLGLVCPSAHLQ